MRGYPIHQSLGMISIICFLWSHVFTMKGHSWLKNHFCVNLPKITHKRAQNISSFSFGENWGKVFVWMLTSIYCRYSRKQNLVGDYWRI